MVKFMSKITILSVVFSLLSLTLTHDLTLDGTMPGVQVSKESADHSNDVPDADKREVCHIFQHMDMPAPQRVRTLPGEGNVSPGRATDAESLVLTPDGPPPQRLIA